MVSTRQMTIGNNGSVEGSQSPTTPEGPAKFTRNSALGATTSTSYGSTMQCSKALSSPVQSIHFMNLPQEILEKIFSYLSFKKLCQLRLMLARFQEIKAKMPRRESARRSHHLACESDIVETLHMRLTLLQMSFGKHIERKHCCFFPGDILDEVYRILHYIKVTPKLDLPYKVTDELFDFFPRITKQHRVEQHRVTVYETEVVLTPVLILDPVLVNRRVNPRTSSSKYLPLDSTSLSAEISKDSGHASNDELESEDLVETIPQSNMVLRKRIRKIKQGMKRYNSQLSLLRQDLRACRRKTSEQQKQIAEQQKQLTEQQKQTLEYATRLDEYDKKNEEISRKFSTLLQELNKCKTELQYWRCKSPATPPCCNHCGTPILPQPEELQALMNQGVSPEGLGLEPFSELAPLLGINIESQNTIEEEKNDTTPNKDKKPFAIDQPSTSVASMRSPKRKTDEPKEEATTKKTRRLSKIRNKRVKV
ncbi:hypothetical protein NQ317_008344 [Molorchus minor]|uniref:F-box domain-containing protein n=1 Tax=Molorchus minor TaxID=1323400 RepID=A0ABQ9IXM2_9CUCU|nr:hypothetical protein NQ317_008344 [Molorchus minor]